MADPPREPPKPPDRPPPKKVSSGTFRAVKAHVARALEALGACPSKSPGGKRCVREAWHSPPHRDAERFEWVWGEDE